MIINHNLGAMNANRNMNINSSKASKSMEKLSSGLRINKAGDDAAGLAISEKMRGQIRGLDQASSNAQDAISLIGTGEGALNETHSILQRMRELAVQSSSDTNVGTDRKQIQGEVDELAKEISRISNDTEFNQKNLLGGNLDDTYQVGANKDQNISLSVNAMDAQSLGVADTATAGEAIVGSAAAAATIGSGGALEFKIDGQAVSVTTTADETKDAVVDAINDAANLALSTTGETYASLDGAGVLEIESLTTGTTSSTEVVSGAGSNLTDLNISVAAGAAGTATTSSAATFAADGTMTKAEVGAGIDVSSHDTANAAIKTINDAIETVSTERSKLGAYTNRLEHTIANLGTSSENLTSAESRIRDVDMAKEMSTFSKNNILNQAAQAMLAQANQQPQQVLALLR
jgi:flagellin